MLRVYIQSGGVLLGCVCVALLGLTNARGAESGEGLRVLPAGEVPADARLGALKDYDGYFPFTPPASLEAWKTRREEVRRQMLVALGLWPMPTKGPINATVHSPVAREGYTVEKVILESYPGHFVTGSLYRPTGREGKLPAVLCPHGHLADGRFHDSGRDAVREKIVVGAERFEVGGRSPVQSMCVQLARMGCVVFHYDMLGVADSQQLSHELAHRFAKQRPDFNTRDGWGFFSAQAELRLQSVMGLQTYNSMRALDWVSQLPDVDPKRIGVTGSSGGGTQTFILAALDERPAVAVPVVMVSTSMQGGCTCENASLLRIGTGNIEMASLIAPRPLGLISADDWTREITTKGFPELKRIYGYYDAAEQVMSKPLLHFPHNYNYVSRAVMYSWMNRHLQLGLQDPIVEEDYVPLSIAEMSVWNESHSLPESGPAHERKLTRWIDEDAQAQLAALAPRDAASWQKYREIVGGAWATLIGRALPAADQLEREKVDKQDHGTYWLFKDLVRFRPGQEELPVLFLHPKQWNQQVVLWFDGAGKAGLFDAAGKPKAEIASLLERGFSVASADLYGQGEFSTHGQPLTETRVVPNPRQAPCYTHGYNHSVFARRVHDVLTLTAFVHHDQHGPAEIHLVGVHGAGPIVAAARAQCGDVVRKTAIASQKFRFVEVSSYRDVNFLPGAVKYGDLPGVLALAAPGELLLVGENLPELVQAGYRAAGAAVQAQALPDDAEAAQRIADWIGAEK